MEEAKKALVNWLSDKQELGKEPHKIVCVKEFDLHELHYYVFRFKTGIFGGWLLGVSGGYEAEDLDYCGHVYSKMEKYDEITAIKSSIEMVEEIRTYWMNQANEYNIKSSFQKNLHFISQTEIDADVIQRQFVKSESRYYLTVGQIDCPTGKIIVADPLCYLAAGKFCIQLEGSIGVGAYPIEVSIFRNEAIGIRMCTARLKIKDATAVRYLHAKPTKDTALANFVDEVLCGFPVEAGMMTICDMQVADEYRTFLDKWQEENPGKNHYDDYFAAYFAESGEKLSAYQREGGDFIEWTNPDTGHKMVMIASGFGDGLYQSYWGYDTENEICELIVPMVNPDLFE